MIVFCEDCGARHDASPEQLQDNRAVFRCSQCGYNNSYVFAAAPEIPLLLETFMNDLHQFPGIRGAMAFHPQHGLINKMPAVLKTQDIKLLLKRLTSAFLLFSSRYDDTFQLIVQVQNKGLIANVIKRQWVFIIVSDYLPLNEDFEKKLQLVLSDMEKK